MPDAGGASRSTAARFVDAAGGVLAAWLVVTATACESSPSVPEAEEGPEGPDSNPVLMDTSGTLPSSLSAFDTFRVSIPSGRMLGVIIASSQAIAVRTRGTQVYSSGGTSAAVIPEITDEEALLQVIHGNWVNPPPAAAYRLRVVGVREAPERAQAELTMGGGLTSEWIDPPLDVDVFTIQLEQGERFLVEAASDARPVSIRIETPGGAANYAFAETGSELATSAVFQAQTSGEHSVTVVSAGLTADVQTSYRLRVARAPDPASRVPH
jgi:hypothetical protein